MPKLSIIIPTYNAEKFLSTSVDSILNQTFLDWELILVNDGSKDNTLALCQKYAEQDLRIKVVDKDNEGAGPARNAGLEIATGKYITFIDADDWLDENAYQLLLDKAEKTDTDLLLFGMRTHICDKNDTIIEIKEEPIQPIELIGQENFQREWASLYKRFNMDSACNKIYKSSILEQYHLRFPDLRRMQDGVFNMYYYAHVTSFQAVEGNFYNRRWNYVDTQRKKMPPNLLECALTHYNTSQELLKKWGQDTDENREDFIDRFVELLHMLEFVFMPVQGLTFFSIYQHIKQINNNKEIHQILKEYKALKGKLRRKEIAMLRRWNFLLAITSYCQTKRRKV